MSLAAGFLVRGEDWGGQAVLRASIPSPGSEMRSDAIIPHPILALVSHLAVGRCCGPASL